MKQKKVINKKTEFLYNIELLVEVEVKEKYRLYPSLSADNAINDAIKTLSEHPLLFLKHYAIRTKPIRNYHPSR
jgi:hypothetical protein